jgi:hypothetical protein
MLRFMKSLLAVVFVLGSAQVCWAGASIGWDEVSARLARSAPTLIKVINDSFDIAPTGGALRLSARSIDVIEGRAGIGDRVPPYEFDCKPKGEPGPFFLRIKIDDWDDGWKFIIHVAAK